MDPARAQLLQLARGHMYGEVLYTSVRLEIAEKLIDGPKSAEEIVIEVQKTGPCHAHFLKRLLRAAAAVGIFDRNPADLKYALNNVSRLLVDGPSSLRWSVLHISGPPVKKAFTFLEDNVRSGNNAFKTAFGEDIFDYFQKHQEHQDNFNKSMGAASRDELGAEILTAKYPLQSIKHVVDVGGGLGSFLANILRRNPHLTGTVYDLPNVAEDGKKLLETVYQDVKDRLTFVGGNFFESVPSGGDLYVSKVVIHDWNDEKAKIILKNIRQAMKDDAKLALLELCVKEGDEFTSVLDILMMVLCDGQERTVEEFQALYEESGLTFTQAVPLHPYHCTVIEGVKKV